MIEEIDFDNRSGKVLGDEVYDYAKKAIQEALTGFEFDIGWQISVSFVDGEEIQRLNAEYRSVECVTDVLSFPMEDSDGRGVALLGDIVLCIDRADEQAREFGHTLEREISYLTVHSVLHLLGYDHEEDDEKSEMRNIEKEIMAKLQIFKG